MNWQGKNKAITFSYDDGKIHDRKLVEIFNKYGLKGTFNLNSSYLGIDKVNPSEVKSLYAGHEVASHTLVHPRMEKISTEAVIWQVEQDRLMLSNLVGYEVVGFAYPFGMPTRDSRIIDAIANHTGIKYARTVNDSHNFDLQDDLFFFAPTIFHTQLDKMFELAEKFLALEIDKPQLFYIWGHSYEFDYAISYEQMEEFCKFISNKKDVFYGTNKDCLL